MKKTFYITTAIDYVNAKPHIGHAFEKVLADVLARWHKQKKEQVFFLTGVDENAQKNVLAAKNAGMNVKEFIDKNTEFFKTLVKELNIDCDKFVRTSEIEHAKVVVKFLKKIIDKKDIYKGKYEGFYCTGCEAFITEKELVDGKCPEHNKKPEFRKEEAYFFKLSKYEKKLKKFVKKYIVPESRKKEILSRIESGLNDLCISRKNADWGIDFPGDKNFKVYVWIDALINYISGAEKQWPADVHVVGKGINWFHSVIWPAILMSANYELPKTLLVHGYLNMGGQKMSKSLGNVIDPLEILKKYGTDAVRYSLLRCSVFEDSDFSEEILIERHNNELANKLGNLVSRVAGLIAPLGVPITAECLGKKNGIEKTENKLLKKLNAKKIENHFKEFEVDRALNEIFAFIDICNEYVQQKKPWETKDKKVLYELKESILKIAELLWPFIPNSAEKIQKQFNSKNIKKGEVLFKKI
ncbi:MAG: methionine--tRNA ligase [Nanoarchaeota archaeon]|nr:methionine--tRNA ligase [Nanoarchaeota archaeon]